MENPAFAGDTIHVECEVIESRASKSRPGRGLVRTHNKVVKQDGTVVLTYTPLRMVKCREQPLADKPRSASDKNAFAIQTRPSGIRHMRGRPDQVRLWPRVTFVGPHALTGLHEIRNA